MVYEHGGLMSNARNFPFRMQSISGVRLWNSLPDNIRKSDSRNLFKKQIHEILINFLKIENAYLTRSGFNS